MVESVLQTVVETCAGLVASVEAEMRLLLDGGQVLRLGEFPDFRVVLRLGVEVVHVLA